MSTTPHTPEQQTWTFLGHWENDRIVVEYVLPGHVQDDRVDTGRWEQGLWAASATATTMAVAQAAAIAPYEDEIHNTEDEDEGLLSERAARAARGQIGWTDDADDEPITHRYVTTLTFDATDDQDAEGLLTELRDAMGTSDALSDYGQHGTTTPRRDATWPTTDKDRADFADWQHEVANGDTLRGFRDWQTELNTDD